MVSSLKTKPFSVPKIIPGSYGRAKISESNDGLSYFLHYDDVMWMGTYKDFSDSFDNLYSQYDLAYGDVLLTGLGFGIIAIALSEKQNVRSVTIIEKEKDIINAFLQNNKINNKITIIQGDATTYQTDRHYDCLLPDHYELQPVDWKIKDMNEISKRISHDVFWPWSIESIFFRTVYPTKIYGHSFKKIYNRYHKDFYKEWQSFIHKYFEANKSLLEISEQKLLKYLKKYIKYCYDIEYETYP